MPPVYVQSASASQALSASASSVALSSSVAAGDTIIFGLTWEVPTMGSVTMTVSDSQGNTYSLGGSTSSAYNNLNTVTNAVYYAVAKSSGSLTITATPSGSAYTALAAAEYSGVGLVAPRDGAAGQSNGVSSGTSLATGVIPVTGPNDLIVAVLEMGTPTSAESVSSPFTIRTFVRSVVGVTTGVVLADAVSSSSQNANFTVTPNGFPAANMTAQGLSLFAAPVPASPRPTFFLPVPGQPWAAPAFPAPRVVSNKPPVIIPPAPPPAYQQSPFYLPIPGSPWAKLLVSPARPVQTKPPPSPPPPPVYGQSPVVAALTAPGQPWFPFAPPQTPGYIRSISPPPPPPPPPPIPGSSGTGPPYLERVNDIEDPRLRRTHQKLSILVNALFRRSQFVRLGSEDFTIIGGAYEMARNPGVTDDSTTGAHLGSLWVNTLTNQAFMCVNATVGGAIWKPVTS